MNQFKKPVLLTLLKNSDIQWHELDIGALFREYGISLYPQTSVTILLIIIHKYMAIKRNSDVWGMIMLKRGLEIQIKTLLGPKRRVEYIDTGSGEFIVLVQNDQIDSKAANLKSLIAKLHGVLNRIMGLSIGVVIGKEGPIERLQYHYLQCIEQKDTLFKTAIDTIDLADPPLVALPTPLRPEQYNFETRFEEAIIAGEPEKALMFLDQIIETVRNYPLLLLRGALLHVAFCAHKCFNTILSNSGFEIKPYDFMSIIHMIQESDTILDAHNVLKDMLSLVEVKNVSTASRHHDFLVNSAKAIIERDYGDVQLYRVSIADQIGVSPDYLSRIFSKATGKSLNQYISDVRMIQAEILLRNPEISIYEILNQCGYNSESWFYKQFKQKYGVTPVEFRRGFLRHKINLG